VLNPNRQRARSLQGGLSIVELMVGVAIGLVIVAAAALLMTGQLVENRRLLVETQLQQDLRGAADIITRELRRAGAGQETEALDMLWYPGTPEVRYNSKAAALSVSTGLVTFDYGVDYTPGPYGFRLSGSGVIETRLGASGWQDLTDGNVMRVLSFTPALSVASATPIQLPCPTLCADGTSDCWPKFQVRELSVGITAEAKSDPAVKRSIGSRVRLRNDFVRFADPSTNRICPA
jgi:type II secretory pathway pseudopilin PulG